MSTTPTPEEQAVMDENDQKGRAAADLEAIYFLKKSPAFKNYFMRRLDEKMKAREAKILDPATSPEDTAKEKTILNAMREDLRFMEEDEVGCRSLLG